MKTPAARNPYLLGLVGVVALALLFTLVALLAPDDWGAPAPVAPGIEVDVDVHHPTVRHSAQARRSPAPRKATAAPRRAATTTAKALVPRR